MTHPAPDMLASRRFDALSDIEDALDALGVPKDFYRPQFSLNGDKQLKIASAGQVIYIRLEDPRTQDEINQDLEDEAEIERGAAGDAAYETFECRQEERN